MARTTSDGSTALGKFLREQRQLARLSLREMARLTDVSNAYLSQVERGMHEPSIRVLHSLAEALRVPVEDLVNKCRSTGMSWDPGRRATYDVPTAIRNDEQLSASQKEALLSVYSSYIAAAQQATVSVSTPAAPDRPEAAGSPRPASSVVSVTDPEHPTQREPAPGDQQVERQPGHLLEDAQG